MHFTSFVGSTHRKPIEVLNELTSLALGSSKNNLPVCSLMVKLVSQNVQMLKFNKRLFVFFFIINIHIFSNNFYQNELLHVVVVNYLLRHIWDHFFLFHYLQKMIQK